MSNVTALYPSCKSAKPDDSEARGFPPGFSVSAYPILACHWFGVRIGSAGHASATDPVKSHLNHHGR